MTNREKTKVPSNILLLDIPLKIIEKYKGKTNGNKLLPILSNQKMNSYLKEVADICGINKKLTYHRARHTFRTIAARKGIRDGIAERIMGHAEGNDIKDIYTHLHDEDIVKEMIEKWNL